MVLFAWPPLFFFLENPDRNHTSNEKAGRGTSAYSSFFHSYCGWGHMAVAWIVLSRTYAAGRAGGRHTQGIHSTKPPFRDVSRKDNCACVHHHQGQPGREKHPRTDPWRRYEFHLAEPYFLGLKNKITRCVVDI
jgi:hypothetical protein